MQNKYQLATVEKYSRCMTIDHTCTVQEKQDQVTMEPKSNKARVPGATFPASKRAEGSQPDR